MFCARYLNNVGLKFLKMKARGRKCKVLHKQFAEMVYEVYQYFKSDSQQAGRAMCNTGSNVARCQERKKQQLLIT
jgi:hypothetical protein